MNVFCLYFVNIVFLTSALFAQTSRIDATQTIRAKRQINSKLTTSEQKKQIPLYKQFSALSATLHHVSLAQLPTPIQRLSKLEKVTEARNLFIKRDDITSPLFGGNKVRKLEFLLGDALNGNAQTILTRGCAGSNHAAATALHAQQIGLQTILYFLDQEPTAYLRRNLLLDFHAGAHILTFDTPAQVDAAIAQTGRELVALHKVPPYYIPGGGSNDVGIIGYINAALELQEQIEQGVMPEPDLIYVALGSGGTAAGLLLGIKLAGLKSKVVAVRVVSEKNPGDKEALVKNLCNQTIEYLTRHDQSFPQVTITDQDFTVNHDFFGNGYAVISEPVAQAVKLLKEYEQITLDGTYAGKAWAALINDLATQPIKDKIILFWDTFCAGEFKEKTNLVDYHQLPATLHPYFECELQPFDQGM